MHARALLAAALCLSAGLMAQVPPNAFDRDPWPESRQGKLKVFVLAGQSNMQGHASLRTLEALIYRDETAARYRQWKTHEGRWAERSDVWVTTTDGPRHGKLRPGFGANEWKLGPELGIGWVLGEALPEQVLLIKACWGGRSVRKDFLSPGSPAPSDAELARELERVQQRQKDATLADVLAPYGQAYRDLVRTVRETLEHLPELFPGYAPERGYELAGVFWFQGWNDFVDGEQRQEGFASYTARLAQMIRDLRAELGAPALPVVIGELGVGGKPGAFQAAQRNVAALEDLRGSVHFVETHAFWDPELERMAEQEVWKTPDWPRFYDRGSDRGYHYLGSAQILDAIGRALAERWLAERR